MVKNYIEILNNSDPVKIHDIPVLPYSEFNSLIDELIADNSNHCLIYFAVPFYDKFKFICCVGADVNKNIIVFSHEQQKNERISLDSITARHFQFHIFEREIHENYGIDFLNHPWLKPVRYSFNRYTSENTIRNYPFYSIESEELHEVGVGPIHAGIIEPGYFRFICNGENVLHLEIQLGFQHRGIESMFIDRQNILRQSVIAENIAGDTAIGHGLCYTNLIESLGDHHCPQGLCAERTIALELERIAIHIGDTAALCTDVAYQLGQVANEALRTIVINTMQLWCGNRFGKGLIRPCGTNYPLTGYIVGLLKKNIDEVAKRYNDISDRIFTLPSVLSRFEGIGRVSLRQALSIGTVGMAARSSGIKRDIRFSHPFSGYKEYNYEPAVITKGDVWARAMLRKIEVEKSVAIIKELIIKLDSEGVNRIPNYEMNFQPSSFAISLVEGWRGEICHTALTDDEGTIIHYKVKDPSMNNWMALALAVRGQEISDFPVCNKSYNLSYCGNDL